MSENPAGSGDRPAPDVESAPPIPSPAAPPGETEDPGVKLDALQDALKLTLPDKVIPRRTRKTTEHRQIKTTVEEIAEDMLEVTRRLKAIEQAQAALASRLEQLDARIWEGVKANARETDTLRRELLGDRKSILARTLFNAIVSHVDSLRAFRQGLAQMGNMSYQSSMRRRGRRGSRPGHGGVSSQAIEQIKAVELSLITALQGLDFHEFHAQPGEPFSPDRMECLGYGTGVPGVVLKAVRPGYLSRDDVIRPAGVLIARTPGEVGKGQEM